MVRCGRATATGRNRRRNADSLRRLPPVGSGAPL